MRIAVLGNSGSWYFEDLARASAEAGHECLRLDFELLSAGCGRELSAVSSPMCRLTDFDAVIVRTMPPGSLEQVVFRMDALARLEAAGIPVINPPKSLEAAVDKYLTTMRLEAAGLPVPRTIICQESETAMQAFETLGGDVVIKPIFGAEGRGICRVSDPDLAFRTFRTLERTGAVLYLQEYIHHPGFDVRILVLDGRVIGGMKRINSQDFRTNVSRSARAEPHFPDDQECEFALRSAASLGTRIAGIDLLTDAADHRYVIEVNAVPGWKAFAATNRIDVARLLIQSLERI